MTAMENYQTLSLRRAGPCLHLTFNRPEARNTLTHAMMAEIGAVVRAVAGEADIRVLVLRGAGGHFCAGGDINFMRNLPPAPPAGEPDPLVAPYRYFGDVLLQLNDLDQAVVAVVDGNAVGGGFGMVCCSDVVITRRQAIFGMPEPRHGFIPSQIIPFVTRRIGEARARYLAVTGARVDGAQAVDWGIAQFCCDDDAAIEAALAQALGQILACSPPAVAAVKRLVLAVDRDSDGAVLDAAAESLIRLLRSPDGREGMTSFLEKRRPAWARQP